MRRPLPQLSPEQVAIWKHNVSKIRGLQLELVQQLQPLLEECVERHDLEYAARAQDTDNV